MSWKKVLPAKKTKNIKYAIRDIVVFAKEVEKTGKKLPKKKVFQKENWGELE